MFEPTSNLSWFEGRGQISSSDEGGSVVANVLSPNVPLHDASALAELSSTARACGESELLLDFAPPVITGFKELYSDTTCVESELSSEFVAELLAMIGGLVRLINSRSCVGGFLGLTLSPGDEGGNPRGGTNTHPGYLLSFL